MLHSCLCPSPRLRAFTIHPLQLGTISRMTFDHFIITLFSFQGMSLFQLISPHILLVFLLFLPYLSLFFLHLSRPQKLQNVIICQEMIKEPTFDRSRVAVNERAKCRKICKYPDLNAVVNNMEGKTIKM